MKSFFIMGLLLAFSYQAKTTNFPISITTLSVAVDLASDEATGEHIFTLYRYDGKKAKVLFQARDKDYDFLMSLYTVTNNKKNLIHGKSQLAGIKNLQSYTEFIYQL